MDKVFISLSVFS